MIDERTIFESMIEGYRYTLRNDGGYYINMDDGCISIYLYRKQESSTYHELEIKRQAHIRQIVDRLDDLLAFV